jgi:hypothetical protein
VPARADILLTLLTPGTPVGSDFLYTYNVSLRDGSVLHAGGGGINRANFFTLYDVAGLVAGSES